MKTPRVSIITPTFNRPYFLNLVFECLMSQSYQDIEWIILDDSPSPDLNLKNKLGSNMKYIYSDKKLSVGEKRNQLIEAASGEYIIHFDDDDFYNQDYIQTLMDVMKSQKADFIIMSGFYCLHLDKKLLGYYKTYVKKGLGFKFFKDGIQTLSLDTQNIPWIHLCFGWCYVFKKEIWKKSPFQSINVFEDRSFVIDAIKNKYKISFYEDKDGIAFHSVHKRSSSVCFPQFILPTHLRQKIFMDRDALIESFIEASA
jgi:glycosyltransferase involved in cell wall biosynthesis